ncbi:hypothetical protein [Desulfocurvus vexinensis]|uniref:hypothetical protein n=1 Tax=Desulfocurvus vexinensis TaxID=399548 RepID=UPI00048E78F9|nr:hypothetical protein [Desulfocurvus vexinensis]
MSDYDTPPKSAPGGGAGKALAVLLVLAAAAVAGYFYMKNNGMEIQLPAKEQLEEHSARPEPSLPPSAPAPLPAQPEAAAPVPPDPGPEPTPSVTMQAAAPRTDKVLTLDFIEDLAAYLAAAYQPGGSSENLGSSGLTTATFRKVNMRYGVELHGLDVDHANPQAGRRQALDHLMSPIVLRLAYDLLAEDLLRAMARAGAGQTRQFATSGGFAERPLTPAQVREMFDLYAARTRDIGRTFQTYASRPELVQLMDRYFQVARRVNAAYARYADREATGAPEQELDAISLEIKAGITEREALRRELLRGSIPASGLSISEGEVLDIAAWVSRRLAADPEAINAVGALASLSQELAEAMQRFEPSSQ